LSNLELVCLPASFRSPTDDPMLRPHRMLEEVIASLRNVIAPAITEPHPKTQAYMAAVILEIVARSVEERRDLAEAKERAVADLFEDLREIVSALPPPEKSGESAEERVAAAIRTLDAARERIGEATFEAAERRVRRAIRELLDRDLEVAKGED
jgi:hypothetical protein